MLLLLDYWPLGRWHADVAGRTRQTSTGDSNVRGWLLLVEKIPVVSDCGRFLCDCPLGTRHGRHLAGEAADGLRGLSNALVSVGRLSGRVVLAGESGGLLSASARRACRRGSRPSALLVLLAVTAAVLVRWRRNPYLLVGWFWYLGMLVPVIGLVQIGLHAMADRYMYLPQIGLSIAVAWSGAAWPSARGRIELGRAARRRVLAIVALIDLRVAADGAIGATAKPSGDAPWTARRETTGPTAILAASCSGKRRFPEAIEQYEAALEIEPEDVVSHCGLGDALMGLGKSDEAIRQYRKAVEVKPRLCRGAFQSWHRLGRQRRWTRPLRSTRSVRIDPNRVETRSTRQSPWRDLQAVRRGDCPVRSGVGDRARTATRFASNLQVIRATVREGEAGEAGRLLHHVAADVADLVDRGVFQTLAALVEMLVDLDGRFLHHGVRFLASADEEEVLAAGQAGLAVVVVEGQPEQGGRFAGFVGGSHGCRLSGKIGTD